jgi:hypothetical protein
MEQQQQPDNATSPQTPTPPQVSKEEEALLSWEKAMQQGKQWQRKKREEEALAGLAGADAAATTADGGPPWASWLEKPKYGSPHTDRDTDWVTMHLHEEAGIARKLLGQVFNRVQSPLQRTVYNGIYLNIRRAVGEGA